MSFSNRRSSLIAGMDPRLAAIFLIVLIDVLGITIILPLLPFYSEHFGAGAKTVGLLVSVYGACQLASGPILGRWSDRYGRKPILLLSQVGTCIGFLVLAFAPSLKWVFLARIIDGITAGNISIAQAYISDVATPKDRPKALGKISIAFGTGFFIGPALTAVLYRFGYRPPILLAATLSLLSIVTTAFLLPKEDTPKQQPRQRQPSLVKSALAYFRKPSLQANFLRIFLFYVSFSAYIAGFALFAERRFTIAGQPMNARQVGYSFAYFGVIGILTQLFCIGKMTETFGERRTAMVGFASSVLGYGVLCVFLNPWWILLSGALSSFGSGVLRPVLLSSIAGDVPPQERGGVIGVTQAVQSFTQIVAPLMSTALLAHSTLALWGLFPAMMNAFGLGLMFRSKPENVQAGAAS
jgi:MFS family permease